MTLARRAKAKKEYQKFADLTSGLLRVSHDEVKAKLDAEKKRKKRKKS